MLRRWAVVLLSKKAFEWWSKRVCRSAEGREAQAWSGFEMGQRACRIHDLQLPGSFHVLSSCTLDEKRMSPSSPKDQISQECLEHKPPEAEVLSECGSA